jgi:hypothetical protein
MRMSQKVLKFRWPQAHRLYYAGPEMAIAQVKALLFDRFMRTVLLKRIDVELSSHMAALRSHLLVLSWPLRVS